MRVDDTAVLDDVTSNGGVILDVLSRDSLETGDLFIECRLVTSKSSEDLLSCNCVRLVDGVVGTVRRAIVAIKAESTATTKVTLRNSACDQVLFDNSGRTKQGADRSCTGTPTNLRVLADIHCGQEGMYLRS